MEKEWFTYEEAMELLGIKRSTLYNLITQENLRTKRFRGDRRRYLAAADIKRLQEIREKPWLAGEANEIEPSVA